MSSDDVEWWNSTLTKFYEVNDASKLDSVHRIVSRYVPDRTEKLARMLHQKYGTVWIDFEEMVHAGVFIVDEKNDDEDKGDGDYAWRMAMRKMHGDNGGDGDYSEDGDASDEDGADPFAASYSSGAGDQSVPIP